MKKRLVWLFWLLPLAVAGSSFFILGADASSFLRWWLAFFLLGVVFFPLSALIFKGSRDGGYLFSKPLALALSTFAMWTLSYLHILTFRAGPILLVIAAFATGLLLSKKARHTLAVSFQTPGSIRLMAIEEAIFTSALLFWSFVRGLKPLVDSLEKPMDFGFMMSLMRTDFLPAKDMWFSQGNINYYYYGQYVYTFMTKLTGMQPDVTYNLSIAATFALTLSLSFALCYLLISYAMKKSAGLYRLAPAIGGGIGAFLVTAGGNSHSFFYGKGHPGNGILIALQNSGWLDRLMPAVSGASNDSEPAGINITDFWFANSTRYIGYNPATHDKTIHEFPYYSFLVADLHAHLINLAFVLLFIALLAVLLHSSALASAARGFFRTDTLLIRNNDRRWLQKELATSVSLLKTTLRQPVFLLCSLLLGIFLMCNFWDFAIYLVVISMVLLVINLRGFGKLGTWDTIPVFLFQVIVIMLPFLLISNPLFAVLGFAAASLVCFGLLHLTGDAFTITGAQISLLFFLSHLLTLPFNLNFEPMSKSMSFSFNHTPLFQFLVLWGPHLLVGLLFILFILRRRSVEKQDIQSAAVRSRGKVTRFLAGMNPMDLFVCGLLVCGFIFLLLPEVVYVVDIYSGDYKRANTMFKFTYQAFVMLSLGIGYAVARMAMTKKTASRFDFRWSFVSIAMIFMLIIPAYYPFVSTVQWMGEIKIENYKGLNGLNGLDDPDRLEAIRWANETIPGQPVMLESYGDSYTEYNRISAYTGLPTVMGWQTHEWLWRTSRIITDGYGQVVKPRQTDVQAMYESQDEAKAKSLFEKYQVEYVVVSSMEKSKFPAINFMKLKSFGKVVFHNDSIDIIHITIPYDYSIVTFKDWDGRVLDTQSINEDGSAAAPSDPIRTGYKFDRWDVAFDEVKNDLTVTALYTINTYTVTFKDWNETILGTQRVDFNESATAPLPSDRTGYTFTGWDKDYKTITSDLVVSAQYVINRYQVLFKDWNGKTLKTQIIDYNEAAIAPVSPVRTGYKFRGWNTAFNKITNDLTVTALYTINTYIVTFKDWDGRVLDTQRIQYNGKATAPSDPLRVGYTFNGWDSSFDGIKNDLTVTALYQAV